MLGILRLQVLAKPFSLTFDELPISILPRVPRVAFKALYASEIDSPENHTCVCFLGDYIFNEGQLLESRKASVLSGTPWYVDEHSAVT